MKQILLKIWQHRRNPKKIFSKLLIVISSFFHLLANANTRLCRDILCAGNVYGKFPLVVRLRTIGSIARYLSPANALLYEKVSKKDRMIFTKWLVKRWGGGRLSAGGGRSASPPFLSQRSAN